LIQHQQQQHHTTYAGATSTTTTSHNEGWSIINITTRLEIFSTKLASQQHQHEAGNLQHEAGISTTSTRSWHLNNINTKLASQQHQHEAGNIRH
jgi:hypothetical protein